MTAIQSRTSLVLLLATTSAAACGEVHGIQIDKTATDIAQAVCPRAYECCTTEQLRDNDAAGTTRASCEAQTANEWRIQLQEMQHAEDLGRARFQPDKVEACLATIRGASCPGLNTASKLSGVAGCESFVTPLVAVEGECLHDYECIDGWCDTPTRGEPEGPGRCRAHLAPGVTCDGDEECGAGFRCDGQSHTCVQGGATAETCFYQIGNGIAVAKTAAAIARTVCPRAYECCTVDQLVNNDAAGATEAECEMKTEETYTNHLEGLQRSQELGRSRYDALMVHACLDTVAASTCADLNMTYHLLGVPGCETFATPLVRVGGECQADYECIDSWCDTPKDGEPPGPGHCTAHAQPGVTCEGDSACVAGYRCDGDSHVCVQSGGTGAACTAANQCQSGVCSGNATTPGTCGPSTAPMCFYQSGCSAGGDGTPSWPTLLLFAAFAVVALLRARGRQSDEYKRSTGSTKVPSSGPQPIATRPTAPASNQAVPSSR